MESRKEVSAALDRILETPAFLRSPRLAQFLRFAVEQRLSERADSPKESEIGVQVFGRPADYDCRIDPVVRVQVRQLRFKLHEYYETVGKDDPFRIELPKGAYLASFCGETARELVPAGPIRRSVQLRWIVAAVAIAAAIAMIGVSRGAWREAARRAWAKTLPAQPKSAQSTAAELYLRGRYYWSKRTPEDLPKAVELDDSLAEAHSSLGFALFLWIPRSKGRRA
jgi:hypothetical protein